MIKSLRAIIKKGTLYTAAFVLAVSSLSAAVPYIVSEQVDALAANVAEINNAAELAAAAADSNINVFSIKSSFTTADKTVLSRSVYVDGNGNTITFAGVSGWASEYVFQAYKTSLTMNNISITGGDAAILANGSNLKLEGAVNVTGNEFGGIEVSQGQNVTVPASLNVTGTLINHSEAYALPTVWSDSNSTVTGPLTKATHIKISQDQYYLDAVKADIAATNVTLGLTYSSAQGALDAALPGNTVRLDRNVNLPAGSLRFVKDSVTLDGNNKIVTAAFVGVNRTEDAAAVYINARGVVISSLTVVGPADLSSMMHGIQAWKASGVVLSDVTIKNSTKYGLQVNGSQVTVNNLTTENSGWVGVEVANPGAHLTVNGVSTHNEADSDYAQIWVVDRESDSKVIDTNSQYVRYWEGAGYAHFLDKEPPVIATTIDKLYNPTSVVVKAHDDQSMKRIDISLRLNNGNDVRESWGEDVSFVNKNDRTIDISQDIANLNLADGNYTVSATVSDQLGKTTNSVNENFIVDRKQPSVAVSLDSITNPTTVSGAVTDATSGPDYIQYQVLVRHNGMLRVLVGFGDNVTVQADGTFTSPVTLKRTVALKPGDFDLAGYLDTGLNLVDGDYVLRVRAFDKAGNKKSGVDKNFTINTAVVEEGDGEISGGDSDASVPSGPSDAAEPQVITPVNLVGQQAVPQGVLGAQTDTDSDNAAESDVKGAATKAVAQAVSTDKDLKELAGLAWYWWLLIAAAAVALFWWIIAAVRRRKNDEE